MTLRRFYMCGALLLLAFGLALSLSGCDPDRTLAPVNQGSDLMARSSSNAPNVAAPSNAAASAVSWSQINVSWQDNSSNESGFEVHRSTTGSTGPFSLLTSLSANTTSFVNTGVSGSTQYCYEVRAFRITGNNKNYSSFSNVACATTPAAPTPPAPSAVHAKPLGSDWITITWVDNSTNESVFRVERAPTGSGPWSSVSTVAANTTVFNHISTFTLERTLCYRVFGVNSYGDSPGSNAFCTAVPAAPTNLAAVVRTDGSVDLTWTDNSAVEDGYQVWRSSNWSWSAVSPTLAPNATAYHDATLAPDSTYRYLVLATRDGGNSDESNVVQVLFATTPPAAPTYLGIRPTSSSEVSGTWVDNSANEAGFRIERSTDDGLIWSNALVAGIDDTAFTESGLSSEQHVCYRVIAFNSMGDSPPSNIACATPPAAPTNLTGVFNGDGTIDLSWTDNSAVEEGYQVVSCEYGQCDVFVELPADATSAQVPDGFATFWYVLATKDGGYSDPSNTWIAVPGGSEARVHSSRGAVSRLRSKP